METTKKKLLIITYTAPYPATDGGRLSIYGTVNYLRHYFDITLVFPLEHTATGSLTPLEQEWKEVTLLPFVYGELETPSFFIRGMRSMLTGLRKIKHRIEGVTAESATIESFPFEPLDRDFVIFLQDLFQRTHFDLIQVEYTSLLTAFDLLPSSAVRIFVQVENRYMVVDDYYQLHPEKPEGPYQVRLCESIETFLMNRYDAVFALNAADKISLGNHIDPQKIFVAPFPVPASFIEKGRAGYSTMPVRKLIFMGAEAHYPNRDAMSWFIESILPLLEGYQLYVAGRWSKTFQQQYPQVTFTGYLENLSPLFQNAIMICPVRVGGGGIRAKVLQGMAAGLPVISTRKGCIGISEAKDGVHLLLAETPSEFADAIRSITDHPAKREQISQQAYELIREKYTEEVAGNTRKEIYTRLLQQQLKQNVSTLS